MCTNLGADYVMVTFAGYGAFPSDDWIKFLWFIRIAHDAYPEISETTYYKNQKFGLTEDELSDKTANTLIFKLMYHRFGEIQLARDFPAGFDFSRNERVDPYKLNYELTNFEEVYTSENWLVRIYRVVPEANRQPKIKNGIEGR